MNEGKTQTFWTSLPGILTGVASLLTALVAVFGLLNHVQKADQAVQTPSDSQSVAPAPTTQGSPPTQTVQVPKTVQTTQDPPSVQPAGPAAVGKLRNLDDCGEFVGKWNWFIGGELRADKNGSVDWRQQPQDALPVIVGHWVCLDTQPQQINISWANGISDTLVFSPDRRSLSGKNTIGVQVSGSKK